jgi:catechol 2,3-dioxygenase-like lactoylglutathione lyase family enzyme
MRKPAIRPSGRVHIHRTVSDMKRAIDFYVTVLGFYYEEGVHDMAWLTQNDLLLTISPGEPEVDLGSYFGWIVDSQEELEQLYDRLYKRHVRLSAPPDAPGGRYYFFAYDPDDYPLAFSYQETGRE